MKEDVIIYDMTLKEKIQETVLNLPLVNGPSKKEISEYENGLFNLEKIAEDFTFGLLDFIEGTYSYSNIFDYWYLHADTSKTFTKKELIETYKKEKGL